MLIKGLNLAVKANAKWAALHQSRVLTIEPKRIFHRQQKFFTIGSCFAEEIRKALSGHRIDCLPQYAWISVDPDRQRIDTLPHREHMNYYNTFSIRQEFERAVGLWHQEKDDIWTLPNREIRNAMVVSGTGQVFQDPYRRLVFGRSEEDLWEAIRQIDKIFAEGIRTADVFVITLGMTEIFRKRNNGMVANQIPLYAGGGGLGETEFEESDYQANLENMEAIVSIIRELNQSAQVVLSVSPVPLARTFSGQDVFVANMLSKATLRTVAGALCRKHDFVHYFPGYEIVTGIGAGAYEPKDLVHVRPEIVGTIINAFVSSHFKDADESSEKLA